MRLGGFLLSTLLGVVLAGPAAAQETFSAADPTLEAWGTQDASVLNISAWGFMPDSSIIDYTTSGNSGNSLTCGEGIGGTCTFRAPLILPSGAQIVQVIGEGCDEDTENNISVTLWSCPLLDEVCANFGFLNANSSGAPGCTLFASESTSGITVANLGNTYFLLAFLPGGGELSLRSVRVLYKLQPSPAPSTATFEDVPTNHPFFQHVEALAASGITSGCGGGNFCPNAPLTRGQMAVFLTKALGLHWPF